MEITVQIAPELSAAVHQDRGTRGAPDVEALADELGFSLRPLHPGTDDAALRSYFIVDVPDPTTAERVLARLRATPAVTAAYVKPPDAMP
jgi:hypothetical protein